MFDGVDSSMTDKNQITVAITASLTTLAEVGGAPESMLYIAACGMDIHFWNMIRDIMVRCDWIQVKGNYVTLTSSGRVIADRLNATIAK